jgi:DNA repair protein RecN (Recombination protein N)
VLSYLRIRGLALVDEVAIELAPGMNVLTGETGAGKSIVVGALSLLRGARARAETIRDGSDAAIVDAQFELEGASAARVGGVLGEHGLPEGEGGGIVVQRMIGRAGKSRVLVQATPTTLGALARLGEELVDICSQHEHHFLTEPSRHLEVLDAHAGHEHAVAAYEGKWRALRDAKVQLAELRARAEDRERIVDYLRFQIDELEQAAPRAGEHEALRRRVGLMRDAARWAEFARDAHAALYEDDDAIASRLAGLIERARAGTTGSEVLAEIEEQLRSAALACEEAARAAARFAGELEVEPGELEGAEDRLHELERLRRKHGVEPDALAEKLERMREELSDLEHADDRLRALEERVAELSRACMGSAKKLHDARVRAAKSLSDAVEDELRALQIPKARLELRFDQPDDEPGPHGIDRVEFLFSANPGEPVAPLRKVASGGELSRVLLALKGALAAGDRVATYVFDEIDAGVGGAVAEAIGRRLKRAADGHQVLCVTHLPQIAAFGDAHFRVEKTSKGGRTITKVVRLSEEERAVELARMLGGAKVGKSALEHAAALLASARAKPAKKPARRQ